KGRDNQAVGFKSKSAYSMRLLVTLCKDREKNEMMWKTINNTDFNSKGEIIRLSALSQNRHIL
ncbi:MAG: hypothetical protein PHN58_05480, partial [Candidatus Cloacimonetes bacterium]|nr:hypothetical protein [Candidatus Cloacimonadota bacterium]